MKSLGAVSVSLLSLAQTAFAVNSFAGSNNYYAYNLPDADRQTLLDGMQTAGMKVLRTWVTGFGAGQKDSDNPGVQDLEHAGLGQWDDTVLDQIDQLMVDAQSRGIKLLIGMHDVNALEGGDIYGSTYGTTGFYEDSAAIDAFYNRITHILNGHNNSLVDNKPWSELSDYIFGFEPQNEPMIFDSSLYTGHLSWICDAAQQIRNNVGNTDMLIFTGGSSGSASVQSYFFSDSCPAIDVVAIHDYNDDWDSFLPSAISSAQAAGKKLLAEEWGSLYSSSSDSSRVSNLQSNVQKINSYGVPWLYWELITNTDPHQSEDYEIDVGGTDWSTIESLSQSTASVSSPFDFSAALAM